MVLFIIMIIINNSATYLHVRYGCFIYELSWPPATLIPRAQSTCAMGSTFETQRDGDRSAGCHREKKIRKSSLARKKRSQPYQKRGKKAKQVRKVGAKDGMAKRNAKFSKFKNKKVTGKINLNIESIMAAKVLRNRGGLRMGDLKTLGQMTDARLKAVQQEKDSKKRVKPARPEKVYQPRI